MQSPSALMLRELRVILQRDTKITEVDWLLVFQFRGTKKEHL